MTSFFKREFQSYFKGLFGWIFLAVMILAESAVVAVVNILGATTQLAYAFATVPDLLVLAIPLLASRTFTKENALGNTVWLNSLPVSKTGRILGKYCAALLLLSVPTAVLALFPLLLDLRGIVSYGSAFSAVSGYFLLGCALLALCTFTASLIRRRWLSVLLNLLLCLVIYFAPVLATVFKLLPLAGFLILLAVCAGIGIGTGIRRKAWLTGVLTGAIPAAVLTLLYFVLRVFYRSFIPAVIEYFSLFLRLDGFRAGHFDLPSTVFYLSTVTLFLFLTVLLPVRSFRKGGTRK